MLEAFHNFENSNLLVLRSRVRFSDSLCILVVLRFETYWGVFLLVKYVTYFIAMLALRVSSQICGFGTLLCQGSFTLGHARYCMIVCWNIHFSLLQSIVRAKFMRDEKGIAFGGQNRTCPCYSSAQGILPSRTNKHTSINCCARIAYIWAEP